MLVKVKLFATLRKGRFNEKELELPEQTTLSDLLEQLKIPQKDAKILLVNGLAAPTQQKLNNSDVIIIFPLVAGG